MKKSVKKNVKLQPKLIFLLGVLTGAIVVGLVFFYSSMSPNQYESAVLQSTRSTLQLSPTRTTTTTTTVLTSPTVNTYSYSALPTPTGN
ncbi:MAG: hypothetical protein NTZ25_04195 [Candidatus Peregrinibacteria bacterium]|nr:hypothetical protein [Candidatus Peregrinibacteria bacterium]